MLGHRRIRWTNIEPASNECLVFARPLDLWPPQPSPPKKIANDIGSSEVLRKEIDSKHCDAGPALDRRWFNVC